MHREHLKLIQEALRHDLPTILSGEEIRRLCSALEADARALWAHKCLDAWADKTGKDAPSVRLSVAGEFRVLPWGLEHMGPTRDAARLSAARAIFPNLPVSVRRELGEEP
jgi:hypothetical protein